MQIQASSRASVPLLLLAVWGGCRASMPQMCGGGHRQSKGEEVTDGSGSLCEEGLEEKA